MKSLLVSLLLITSISSGAFAAEKTIKGKEAKALQESLMLVKGEFSIDDESDHGFEFYGGSTNESLAGDDVNDHWEQVTVKVGDKTVSCESHVFMMFKVSKKNKNAYKDSYECTISN